jgi:hypothetical protein
MKLLLLASLLVIGCASSENHLLEKPYYWVSGNKYDECQKSFTRDIKSLQGSHSLKLCKEDLGQFSGLYSCTNRKGRKVKMLVSDSENICYSTLRSKLGVEAYGMNERFIYKGVKFSSFIRKLHSKKSEKYFWTYGFLRSATKSEVHEALKLNESTDLHSSPALIQSRDVKTSYKPGTKVKFLQALSTEKYGHVDEVEIKGKKYLILDGRFGGVKPNFYEKKPKFIWKSRSRKKEEKMVAAGKIFEGMSAEAFRSLLMDEHFKVNHYESGRMEQWVSADGKDLYYFRGGKLQSWQLFNR